MCQAFCWLLGHVGPKIASGAPAFSCHVTLIHHTPQRRMQSRSVGSARGCPVTQAEQSRVAPAFGNQPLGPGSRLRHSLAKQPLRAVFVGPARFLPGVPLGCLGMELGSHLEPGLTGDASIVISSYNLY
jgi:hypothetical protein